MHIVHGKPSYFIIRLHVKRWLTRVVLFLFSWPKILIGSMPTVVSKEYQSTIPADIFRMHTPQLKWPLGCFISYLVNGIRYDKVQNYLKSLANDPQTSHGIVNIHGFELLSKSPNKNINDLGFTVRSKCIPIVTLRRRQVRDHNPEFVIYWCHESALICFPKSPWWHSSEPKWI